MTLTDPASRKLRCRQLQLLRHLRRTGKAWVFGYVPPDGSGVERIWRAHGWVPSERIVTVTVETRRAA